MSGLKMPSKGRGAAMLQELNAEHAPLPTTETEGTDRELESSYIETNVTTLQETNEATKERTGEATHERANEASNDKTIERSKQRSFKVNNEATFIEAPQAAAVDANDTSGQATIKRAAERRKASKGDADTGEAEREARRVHALQRAQEDEVAVVTVRVSARLNQYMDEYVARHNRLEPKRRYRKQDAVAEAFAAFYAEHVLPSLPVEEDL